MQLPEAGRHAAAGALHNDEAAQRISGDRRKTSVPGADVELVSIRKCVENREDKVQSIADVERTADPLLESDGQHVSLSSICTYPDLRLLLIMLLFTIAFTIAEMLGAVMANSISMAADSGTMVVGKYALQG
jgi:hypothetical protein